VGYNDLLNSTWEHYDDAQAPASFYFHSCGPSYLRKFYQASSIPADIADWDTRYVTSMEEMFTEANETALAAAFTSLDFLSKWNTAKVENFGYMFSFTTLPFNEGTQYFLDLGTFDLRSATSLEGMFQSSTAGGIRGLQHWDTGSVLNVKHMFMENDYGTDPHKDSVFLYWNAQKNATDNVYNDWNLQKVTSMQDFMRATQNHDPNVANWHTPALEDMHTAFGAAVAFTGRGFETGNFRVDKVTTFKQTFAYTSKFTGDLSSWNVSSAVDVFAMFYVSTAFVGDGDVFTEWNTHKVTDFTAMFKGAEKANPNVAKWNTISALRTDEMFHSARSLTLEHGIPLASVEEGAWNVAKVFDMDGMFQDADSAFIRNFTYHWDTRSLKSLDQMFGGQHADGVSAVRHNMDPWFGPNWDTSKVTDMSQVFHHCAGCTGRGLEFWNTALVTSMGGMFEQAVNLDVSEVDKAFAKWNTAKVWNMAWMFKNAERAPLREIKDWTANLLVSSSSENGLDQAFYNAVPKTGSFCEYFPDLSRWQTGQFSGQQMAGAFGTDADPFLGSEETYSALRWDTFGLGYDALHATDPGLYSYESFLLYGTPCATSANHRFYGDVTVPAHVKDWDFSRCTDMASMFEQNPNVGSLAFDFFATWNVYKVTSFKNMFKNSGSSGQPRMDFPSGTSNPRWICPACSWVPLFRFCSTTA
jgi:surface protein